MAFFPSGNGGISGEIVKAVVKSTTQTMTISANGTKGLNITPDAISGYTAIAGIAAGHDASPSLLYTNAANVIAGSNIGFTLYNTGSAISSQSITFYTVVLYRKNE